MGCLFITVDCSGLIGRYAFPANAAGHTWARCSQFHHFPQLILNTASTASARARQLSSVPSSWESRKRRFWTCLCSTSRFVEKLSWLCVFPSFKISLNSPRCQVFLWPHSSLHNCLRSIMFCGVNLLTWVSSGTSSWTASRQLSFHPLPIFPLSPINQCDVIAWTPFPTARAWRFLRVKVFSLGPVKTTDPHNCSAPGLHFDL